MDGFRIDVAMGLYKAEGLPDTPPEDQAFKAESPIWGRPEVHEVYREWRKVLDSYQGERMAIGEVWTDSAEDLALYVRPDELHQSFNFAWLEAPWSATAFKKIIDDTLAAVTAPTWVLSNHDVIRHVTRYGEGATGSTPGLARAVRRCSPCSPCPGRHICTRGRNLVSPR